MTVVVGRPPTIRCSVSMVVNTSASLPSLTSDATLGGRELRELPRELGRELTRLDVLAENTERKVLPQF